MSEIENKFNWQKEPFELVEGQIKNLMEEVLTEEQIILLTKWGYFTAPASSSKSKHNAFKGGLAVHSLNVVSWMLKYNQDYNLGLKREHIILSGLLHDLGKTGDYQENILKNGTQSGAMPFKKKPVMMIPHQFSAVYLSQELGLKLSVPVVTAITYHMGFSENDILYNMPHLKQLPYDLMLVLCLQFADQWATWVTEPVLEE